MESPYAICHIIIERTVQQ